MSTPTILLVRVKSLASMALLQPQVTRCLVPNASAYTCQKARFFLYSTVQITIHYSRWLRRCPDPPVRRRLQVYVQVSQAQTDFIPFPARRTCYCVSFILG